jgi:hypothetical protein
LLSLGLCNIWCGDVILLAFWHTDTDLSPRLGNTAGPRGMTTRETKRRGREASSSPLSAAPSTPTNRQKTGRQQQKLTLLNAPARRGRSGAPQVVIHSPSKQLRPNAGVDGDGGDATHDIQPVGPPFPLLLFIRTYPQPIGSASNSSTTSTSPTLSASTITFSTSFFCWGPFPPSISSSFDGAFGSYSSNSISF